MLRLSNQLSLEIILQIMLRILSACLIGGMIGFEREKKNHPAGLRTHLIVCLAACLIMILAFLWHAETSLDTTRLAQGAISGIGFLGAGTILRDGNKVRGLTTAASVWMVACLGLLIGAGLFLISFSITIIIIFVLIFLANIEKKFIHSVERVRVKIKSEDITEVVDHVNKIIEEGSLRVENIEVDRKLNTLDALFLLYKNKKQTAYIKALSEIDGVNSFKIYKRQ